jgi:hypothetical protein
MSQTAALALIGIVLVAGCVGAMQAARAVARARIRRQLKMMRMCSVVAGSPDEPPDA